MKLNFEKGGVCPCCGRHCSVDNLHCPKGRNYFGLEDTGAQHDRHRHFYDDTTVDGKAITMMLRCGHFLHHSAGEEPISLSCLSEEEKAVLISLLNKCLESWKHN